LPKAPIPIWMGSGTDDRVLRRVARLGDGWTPMVDPTEPMTRLCEFLKEAGRDPATFGLTARIAAGPEGPAGWVEAARRLQGVGATHIAIGAPPDMAPPQALARIIEAKNVLAGELGS